MRHLERHHYSGPASRAFWRRIWKLNTTKGRHRQFVRLYAMGCTLQNKEERMLCELRKAEHVKASA